MPPSSQEEIDRLAEDLRKRVEKLSPEELRNPDKQLDDEYPGGFTARDEANALIALSVRNGPIEELHAGKSSELLEDDTLSRITDAEMKVLMLNATRMLAGLLRMRDTHPEIYRRYVRTYGKSYCQFWERE